MLCKQFKNKIIMHMARNSAMATNGTSTLYDLLNAECASEPLNFHEVGISVRITQLS